MQVFACISHGFQCLICKLSWTWFYISGSNTEPSVDLQRKALSYFHFPAGRCLWVVHGLSSTRPAQPLPSHLNPLNILLTFAAWTFLWLILSDVASIIVSVIAIFTRDLRSLFLMKSKEGVFYFCVFINKPTPQKTDPNQKNSKTKPIISAALGIASSLFDNLHLGLFILYLLSLYVCVIVDSIICS